MASGILPPGQTMVLAPRHEALFQHREQIGKVDASRIAEADYQHAFILAWDMPRGKRVGGVDDRHALEIDLRLGKLRADFNLCSPACGAGWSRQSIPGFGLALLGL